MTRVNYKEIKARVRMEQVLERYGVLGELREKGDNLVGRCPIHKGTNGNQFHVSRTKNNFMCFGNCHDGVVYLYPADNGGGPVRSRQHGVNQTVMVSPTGITGPC